MLADKTLKKFLEETASNSPKDAEFVERVGKEVEWIEEKAWKVEKDLLGKVRL